MTRYREAKRDRECEARAEVRGMVRAPRHVDGIEVTYARRYEVARDWLFEFRRLTRAGVAWEAMPLAFRDEVACAVAWVFRNEATLVAMGLRDP